MKQFVNPNSAKKGSFRFLYILALVAFLTATGPAMKTYEAIIPEASALPVFAEVSADDASQTADFSNGEQADAIVESSPQDLLRADTKVVTIKKGDTQQLTEKPTEQEATAKDTANESTDPEATEAIKLEDGGETLVKDTEDKQGFFDRLEKFLFPSPIEIDYELVKPNVVGNVMVLMYHGLLPKKPHADYMRTINDFKSDLQKLYDGGYRLVSLSDLIENNISVPAGTTPVVLTFDDGLATAFSLVEKDGKLVPKEDCAVDIINKFSENHKDFGRAGIFFVNGNQTVFKGAGTIEQRFKYLVDNGYEIGNHTFSHKQLNKLNSQQLQAEIGKLDFHVDSFLPGYKINAVAYPYGVRPRDNLLGYTISGEYDGRKYNYALGIKEGQTGASAAPNHKKFDPLNFPRVRGSDNAETDLGWQLRYFEKHPELRYISDGFPNRISVPKKYEGNVNMDSIGDKELYVY